MNRITPDTLRYLWSDLISRHSDDEAMKLAAVVDSMNLFGPDSPETQAAISKLREGTRETAELSVKLWRLLNEKGA